MTAGSSLAERTDPAQFSHEAFFYSDLTEFLEGACGFIRDGLERNEAVLVATGGERLAALRSLVGDEPDVALVDMAALGANPARIIPAWQDFLDLNLAGNRMARGIGEPVWAGRTDAELAECQQHESLLNLAFDEGPPWRLLCPYDTSALPEPVLDEVRDNHPWLLTQRGWEASDTYRPERAQRALRARPLPPPAELPVELPFSAGDLPSVRRLVERRSVECGLGRDRCDDLVLCVDEVATNSLLHGGGLGVLRIWREPTSLVCEVSDAGTVADQLAGRRMPGLDGEHERGLWLANQLCDLVQLRSGPAGTTIRLHMTLGRP